MKGMADMVRIVLADDHPIVREGLRALLETQPNFEVIAECANGEEALRMTEKLKLTDEQKPKVKAVLEESQKKRQELFSDSSVPREDRREKMKGINDNEDKKLKGILTAEQYTEYEKMKQQMATDRKGGKKSADEPKTE